MEVQEAEDLTPRSRFYLPVYRLADACLEVRRQKVGINRTHHMQMYYKESRQQKYLS